MSNIPQNIIDRIVDAADIVEVIGDDVSLKRQGANFIGLCPFHSEKNGSFFVSPSKRIFKCFGCGEGGNVITFLIKKDGLSFPEAVRYLGKKYNVEVPERELTPEEKEKADRLESTRIVMAEAQSLFRQNLSKNADAQAYLTSRKIDSATADEFGIGYALDYDGLSAELVRKGYSEQYILAAGLAYKDGQKNTIKDFFRQRILFPFLDKRGNAIGYSGRDITGRQPTKYKNTGETELFTKGNNIFGLYQARKAIQKEDKVYIVEGQFDVVSVSQAGVKNVVGGSGTAFTDEQRKLLHSYTCNVVFVYDGDSAGLHAAQKNLDDFVKSEFRVRCIRLAKGKDPDDVAKSKGKELSAWMKKSEMSYVDFLCGASANDEDDEFAKLEKAKKILEIIMHERESIIRDRFTKKLAELSGFDLDKLEEMAAEIKVPQQPAEFEPGFIGLDFAADYIDKETKEIHLVSSFARFQKLIGEKQPYAFFSGVPTVSQIQELSRLAEIVVVHSPDMDCDSRRESDDCVMMKELYKFGLTIDVYHQERTQGFIYYYVEYYGSLMAEEGQSPEKQDIYIKRCAEMISCASQSVQTLQMDKWSMLLGVKASTLKAIIKQYTAEREKKRAASAKKSSVDNDLIDIDPTQEPDYVNENEEYKQMLARFGFFPGLNKSGIPVCYMFRRENGHFERVGNFFIEPLFHVYAQDKVENKRVVKLNSSMQSRPSYVEWPSVCFSTLTAFREMLICEGNYWFGSGTARDFDKIWGYLSGNFPKCTKIRVYGQQEEGCFLFANGIFHAVDGEWTFDYADELGLMRHGEAIFYSPAFSKINVSVRKDDDQYQQDRWLSYTDTPKTKRTTFERWAALMDEVYSINDNGKWALIYSIMCAFRSEIHPINRLFTALFFIGPTMSGKTQIAVSIRSLFIKPEAPCFNLNSGTDAAFFSVLERFRDVPQVMEEYNDKEISDNKFQGLKAVTYDGDGKQKRKAATGNDIETSKINSPVILLGQEAPQRDDNSLGNRVVLCEVPKSESINGEHQQQIFQELKQYEKDGLSYLLIEILKLRPVVREHFAELMKSCGKELQACVEVQGGRTGDQARIINTISMFLTMCRILTDYAPHLRLPFTYTEFRDLCVDKIKSQVSLLTKTDKLATFFDTVDYLMDKGAIKYGRDLKIERPTRMKFADGREMNLSPSDTAVLYMRLSNIHRMYTSQLSAGEDPLSLTTLEVNLNSNRAFLGKVKSTRFAWLEAKDVPLGEMMKSKIDGQPTENMTLARVMERKEKNTSAVVMNYDLLKQMMDIDLERKESEPEKVDEPEKLPF